MAETGPPLTQLLGDFGIDYPNAPEPTPALLAFMRGLGMNLAQSEDIRRQGIDNVKARTTSAHQAIDRGAERSKQSTTADLVRRGVLRSGEANTKFARQDEDTAVKRADVERGRTEATQGIENAYEQVRGGYRQQALERVLSTEEQNSTREATSKAQEDAFKRQEAASQTEFERQRKLNDENLSKMEALYAKYGAQGVAL